MCYNMAESLLYLLSSPLEEQSIRFCCLGKVVYALSVRRHDGSAAQIGKAGQERKPLRNPPMGKLGLPLAGRHVVAGQLYLVHNEGVI